MRRLDCTSLFALALLTASACTGADDGDAAESGNEPVDPTEADGETEGDTEADTETGGDPDDPLAACRELPGAASWLEGEPIVSTAESTDTRIAAAGAQTWPLALQLMRVVPMEDAASIAASPASMYAAMGLSYGRWQNQQCGDRIAEVMAFPELGDELHQTLGASIRELQARALPAEDDVDPVALSMQQSIWAFNAESLPEPTAMLETYGAVQNGLGAPDEAARELINCVIETQSAGLLPDFLPPGNPAPDTDSYDINVSFLQAPWAVALEPRSIDFTFSDGSSAQVDGFGSSLADVVLYEGDTFTSVELGLRGGELAMMAVLPTDATQSMDAFAEALTAEDLAAARDQARLAVVDLAIPEVKIEGQTLDYNEGRLDFQCDLFTLRSVFHGAAVEIDRIGIKAAAATVNEGWNDGGEPEPELTLVLDRPFLFFVYDRATSFVLYSGRWAPEQGG